MNKSNTAKLVELRMRMRGVMMILQAEELSLTNNGIEKNSMVRITHARELVEKALAESQPSPTMSVAPVAATVVDVIRKVK